MKKLSIICCFLYFGLFGGQIGNAQKVEFLFSFGSEGTGNGQFDIPRGIAVSDAGLVYVTDRDLHRVQVFDTAGNYQFQFGTEGNGAGQFYGPFDVAISPTTGNIHVADHDNRRVQVFDAAGNYLSQFGTMTCDIRAVGVDSSGRTFVDNGECDSGGSVHVYDDAGQFLFEFGSLGSGPGQFDTPHGFAYSVDGNVYVADSLNDRIQVFDGSGNYQFEFGGTGTGNGQLNGAWGVAIDDSDVVYVTDVPNDRVQAFDSKGNYLFQFGSEGSGDGQFNGPDGIAIDNENRIYVVEVNNQRVQVFQIVDDATEVNADQFNIFRGLHISGDLSDSFESDDSYLKFNPGFVINSAEAPVWLIFDGTLPSDSPASLEIVMESNAGTPGLTHTLEAWNWTSAGYDVVDVSAASFNNDVVVTVDLTSGIPDYAQAATGAVRTRVGWRKTGLVINFPWEVRLDQMVWIVQ